jgi:hypothetical protein
MANNTLLYLVIGIGIVLLLREVNCWYWKINQVIDLLEKISSNLLPLEQKEPPPQEPPLRPWAG